MVYLYSSIKIMHGPINIRDLLFNWLKHSMYISQFTVILLHVSIFTEHHNTAINTEFLIFDPV